MEKITNYLVKKNKKIKLNGQANKNAKTNEIKEANKRKANKPFDQGSHYHHI